MERAGDGLEAESHRAANDDGLGSDDLPQQVEPVDLGPVFLRVAFARRVPRGFVVRLFGGRPVKDVRLAAVAEPRLRLAHMREPIVNRARLAGRVEPVGDEAAERPLAVLDVPAADHKDDGVGVGLRELGEVVVKRGDVLEVDEEFDGGLGRPFVADDVDALRADDGAAVAVRVQDLLQRPTVGVSVDSERLRGRLRVFPRRDSCSDGGVALLRPHLPELDGVFQSLDDFVHGVGPWPVGGVRPEFGDGGRGVDFPFRAFGSQFARPFGGGHDAQAQVRRHRYGAEPLHRVVAESPPALDPSPPEQERAGRSVALDARQRVVVDVQLRLVGGRGAAGADLAR